jgi:hypothetical protein
MHFISEKPIQVDFVTTIVAAAMLCRSPQRLCKWACDESGPLRPTRIHGRLAWSVEDIDVVRKGGRVINKDGRKTNYMKLGLVAA